MKIDHTRNGLPTQYDEEPSKLTRYEVKYSEKEDRRQVLPKITQCKDLQKQIFKLVGVKNPMSLERFVW